jgi:hypothetical protein
MQYALLTSWYALDESISCMSIWTGTSCSMISNQTDGSQATNSTGCTWVYALSIQASLVQWTVCVEHTLRATADWRVTFKPFHTRTHCSSSQHLAVCIDSTWAGVAWITWWWNCTNTQILSKWTDLFIRHGGVSVFLTLPSFKKGFIVCFPLYLLIYLV